MNSKKIMYEDSLFYQINLTAKCFDKLFDQFFSEAGFTITAIEHLSLLIIGQTQKCCQRDLARKILKDRANTGKLAKILEQKKLIKIIPDIKNNRPVKILILTDKGQKTLNDINNVVQPKINELKGKISKAKMDEIKKSLKNFREIVESTIKTNI